MKKYFIYIIFFISSSILNYIIAQEEKKLHNSFGAEIGAGYNTLNYNYNRQSFWVQPTGRIFYSPIRYSFSETKIIKIPAFIGYYTFGGKSTNVFAIPEDPISKEIYLFRSIETGINPCLETNNFQIGLLFKGQYIFSAKHRTYHDPFWNNGVSMEEREIKNDFKEFAMNTGMKLKYKINKFSLVMEAWFGITNLNSNYYPENIKVHENNYRILLGYEF